MSRLGAAHVPTNATNSPELLEAVSALIDAGDSYRQAFFHLSSRLLKASDGENEDFRHVVEKRGDLLHLADCVINAWRMQLGHDEDEI
jgi:hypothetical protein